MSAFQNAIAFLVNLGVYDVVLPFLLVFTLVYALLEKTRVLGTETIDGQDIPKKNLNAMIAFVTGFLIIASSELVRIINNVLANSVLLILLSVLFMMLAGSFYKEGEFELGDSWKKFFMFFMFSAIILIFLHAMGWLSQFFNYLVNHIDGPVVGSFLLLGVVVGGMVWITSTGTKHAGDDE